MEYGDHDDYEYEYQEDGSKGERRKKRQAAIAGREKYNV